MPEERICAFCGRANPMSQPRCINCGQRAQGVVLVAEREAPSTSAWWSGSTTHQGAIPPPPQVRDEVKRAETLRLDEERRKTERERRATIVRELRESRRRADEEAAVAASLTSALRSKQAKAAVVQTDCGRCGMPMETTASGEGFSFCLRCGAEAPQVKTEPLAAPGATASAATAAMPAITVLHTNGARTTSAPTQQRSGVSPGAAAILSFFIPGVGQFLNGQAAKGTLLLLASFVAYSVLSWMPMGLPMLIAGAVAAADAYRIAERRRRGVPVRDGEWDLG